MTALNIIIGQQVRKYRELKGMSQASLSRQVLPKENRGFIYKLETGKRNITIATLEKIMEVLDFEIDFKPTDGKTSKSDLH